MYIYIYICIYICVSVCVSASVCVLNKKEAYSDSERLPKIMFHYKISG